MPTQLWDALPGETGAAYRAFCIYRDLGPERSIASAYAKSYLEKMTAQAAKRDLTDAEKAKLSRTPANTEPPGHWRAWSRTNQWVERSAAWDAHLDAQRRDVAITVARREALVSDAEWEVRRMQQRQKEWQLREKLIARVEQMLEFPLARKVQRAGRTGLDSAGQALQEQITIFEPVRWSMFTVVEIVKLISEIGRTAANMPVKAASDTPSNSSLMDQLFESNGQLENAVAGGTVPAFPEDPLAKPTISEAALGKNTIAKQPKAPLRPK